MWQLLQQVKHRSGLFATGCIAALIAGTFSAEVITMIRHGLEYESEITSEWFTKIIIYSLIAASVGVAASYFISRLNIIIVRDLTKKLVNKTMMTKFEFIETVSDKVLPIITKDISDIANYVDRIPTFIIACSAVLINLVELFIIDTELTAYFFIIFALQIILVMILIPLLKKYGRIAVQYRNYHFRNLGNMIKGLKELTLNKEKRDYYLSDVISQDLGEMNKAFLKGRVTNGTTQRINDLLIFLFVGMLMYSSMTFLDIDFERFKIFLPTILFIVPYFAKISGFFQDFKGVEVAFEQINSISEEIEQYSITNQQAIEWNDQNENLITLENIKYQYLESRHDNQLFFGPLNLSLKKGNITFIIGGNGSGKTTFAKILTGLYEPREGKILYNGHPIDDQHLIDYRNKFSAYFADSYTFEQLGYIDHKYLEKHSSSIIKLLEMESKVKLDDKYNFSTTSLSFGQISRLSLITKILEDKEIYLFDEWAANQDPYFKNIFYHKILPLLKSHGKTIIVISHDDKYFDVADEIIELQEGMKTE